MDAKLRDIPSKLQAKALRGAVGAGAKIIRDAARSKVSSKSGNLVDAIRHTTRVNQGTGQAIAKVFVSQKKAWYGRLVEGGTKPHIIRPRGAGKGRTEGFTALHIHGNRWVSLVHHPGAKPKPFMRPAAESNYPLAVDAMAAKLRAFFEKLKG